MLRRGTKIQLILFVIITLVGISYVSADYIGLTKYITGNTGCQVSADFPDSGGIFTNAEVTYRGVTVGKVGSLSIIPNGVRVGLDLDSCSSPKIPASTTANVNNRSVVGEQYINLVPPLKSGSNTQAVDGNGPYLAAGSIIPMSRNTVPVATQTLLTNIDTLVNSVDLDNLRTTVSELGTAVSGRGQDLGNLLDATNALLATASTSDNLNATIKLIDDAAPVLQTQLSQADPLRSWTHSLLLISQQLKKSDPDIRHLLDTAPSDLNIIKSFVQDNQTDIGVTLANLITVGNLLVAHLPGLEEVFELYPALGAGGQTALHDNLGALGLILQVQQTPEDCGDPNKGAEGYEGTAHRLPSDTSPAAPNVAARCTASPSGSNFKNVRGSANIPGGDPISTSQSGTVYPRTVTPNTLSAGSVGSQAITVGPSLSNAAKLGDASWLGLLTDALH